MALTTDEAVNQILAVMEQLNDMDQANEVLDIISPHCGPLDRSDLDLKTYLINKGFEIKDIYEKNGYSSRSEYLQSLADNSGIDINTVLALADMLGPNEDFDGLVSTIEDME